MLTYEQIKNKQSYLQEVRVRDRMFSMKLTTAEDRVARVPDTKWNGLPPPHSNILNPQLPSTAPKLPYYSYSFYIHIYFHCRIYGKCSQRIYTLCRYICIMIRVYVKPTINPWLFGCPFSVSTTGLRSFVHLCSTQSQFGLVVYCWLGRTVFSDPRKLQLSFECQTSTFIPGGNIFQMSGDDALFNFLQAREAENI